MPSIRGTRIRISRLFDKDGKPVPEQKELKILQRLYEISPSPEALDTLSDVDLHSASEILKMPQKLFISEFKAKVGGAAVALKIYANARKIYNHSKKRG